MLRNNLSKSRGWVSTRSGRKKLSERNCYCPFLTCKVSPSAGSDSFEQLLFLPNESQNDFQSFHSFWHKGYRRLFRLLISQEPLKLPSTVKHWMAAAKKTIPWRGKQPACALMLESHTRGKELFWAGVWRDSKMLIVHGEAPFLRRAPGTGKGTFISATQPRCHLPKSSVLGKCWHCCQLAVTKKC